MKTNRDLKSLKILLVEARKDAPMIEHERSCIEKSAGLSSDQITILDVLKEPLKKQYLDYDVVMIGGTGDYGVAQDRPDFFDPLVDFTKELLEKDIPTLGLCYGFHLMAHAVGGVVETREDMEETGTYEIFLTPEGEKDPILGVMERTFLAQQGHHDVVLSMPEPYVRLAYSERCQWQAFCHPDKLFYGLQFHPELSRDDFLTRMRVYGFSYATSDEAYQRISKQTRETHSQPIVTAFLERVLE